MLVNHPLHLIRCQDVLTEFLPNYQLDRETFNRKLNWLMSIRFLFALLLLGSTLAYQVGNQFDPQDEPIAILYGLPGAIVFMSAV